MTIKIRRRVRRPPDLTSLFDVLFIVVFVALIRAAAAQKAEAEAKRPPPPPPTKPQPPAPPPDVAALRERALANLGAELAKRTPLVIRLNDANVVEKLEAGDKVLTLDVPLLEETRDVDVPLAYLGDRSASLQLCAIAATQLGVRDLAQYLVIVSPARAFAQLPVVLVEGLHHDFDRCLIDQRGLATLVDPGAP